jgi:hypothetical protein
MGKSFDTRCRSEWLECVRCEKEQISLTMKQASVGFSDVFYFINWVSNKYNYTVINSSTYRLEKYFKFHLTSKSYMWVW